MEKTTTRNVLVMTFDSNNGEKRLRLPNPRTDLTGSQIKKAMTLIAQSAFFWDNEPSLKVNNAKVVKTITDNLDITAE